MSLWSRLVLFVTLVVCSFAVRGAPITPNRIAERQVVNGKLVGPMTFNQVTSDVEPSGTRVETCVVTLTPQSDGTVLEDRKCTTKFTPSIPNNGAGSASGTDSNASRNGTTTTITRGTPQVSTSATVASSTSTTGTSSTGSVADNTKVVGATPDVATTASAATSSVPAVAVLPSSSGSGSVASSSSVQTTALNAAATPAKAPAISVIGTTLVSASNASATPTASATVAADQAASTSAAGDIPAPASSSSASASATAAQDQASSTSAPASATLAAASTSPSSIQLPGTKLSVLPIGLGVFGGISVIALIVVGYVMWERTKYRKNFRARQKLSEQGANPGYGGMSQRV